ncbi:hypothetical protein KY318_03510, partial [Candidatus Woesearchaeota archaeon]|nr:hypothetical protein [Candidatus Woesearchaeota archaeon]
VSSKCGVSPATTYRILNRLSQLNILRVNKINRFKFYQLEDNERTRLLENLISKDPLQRFVSLASKVAGVKVLILYGIKRDTGANILVIGSDIDTSKIDEAVAIVRKDLNFTIKYLCFTVEQFEQMAAMGMYSQPKKILWKNI